jgi:hypothetical protein
VARETTGVGERLIMDDADEKPMVNIDPRYLLTGDVVERPADERPKHDTIEAIAAPAISRGKLCLVAHDGSDCADSRCPRG